MPSSDRYAPTEGSDERRREGKKSGNATEYLREEMNLRFQLSSKDGRRKMPALSENTTGEATYSEAGTVVPCCYAKPVCSASEKLEF